MLRLLGNRKMLCDGISRRDLLHIGGLGAFGVGLSDFLALQKARAAPCDRDVGWRGFGQAKSCL